MGQAHRPRRQAMARQHRQDRERGGLREQPVYGRGVYYRLEVEPYTPAHHFEGGKDDPGFRTKPRMACQLVERSVEMGVPFRAVVADSSYGEDRDFKRSLEGSGIGYVLALKRSHSWWHSVRSV